MLGHFLKIQQLKERLEFQGGKRLQKLYKKEKFSPDIKSMIQSIQDDIYQSDAKSKNLLNFMLILNGSSRTKNTLKPFSRYLKDKICKIKQANIIATGMTFSFANNLYKNLCTKERTSKATTTEFRNKTLLKKRKYSTNNFIFMTLKYL